MTVMQLYASIRFSNFGWTPEEGPFNVATAITYEKAKFMADLIDECIEDISINGIFKYKKSEVDDFNIGNYYNMRDRIKGQAILRNFVDDFLFDTSGVYNYIKEAVESIKKDNPYLDKERVPRIYKCIEEKIKSLKLSHKKKTYINYFKNNEEEDVYLVYNRGRLVGGIGKIYVSCDANYILFIQNEINEELNDKFIYSEIIKSHIEEILKEKLEEERNWI